jgi:hypothetical protein
LLFYPAAVNLSFFFAGADDTLVVVLATRIGGTKDHFVLFWPLFS